MYIFCTLATSLLELPFSLTTNEIAFSTSNIIYYVAVILIGIASVVLKAGQFATFKVTVSYKNVSALPTAAELALINEIADGNTGATSLFSVSYVQA